MITQSFDFSRKSVFGGCTLVVDVDMGIKEGFSRVAPKRDLLRELPSL
jgi:hypothetical protein